MDVMQDVLADGRRFRTLHVRDIVTRECLAIAVDTSLPGRRVVRLLDLLILWRGAPKRITLDNGLEFTGQALDVWAYEHSVTLDFIEPGRPTQNGYLERFNGKFRDECLNVHSFRSLAAARQLIESSSRTGGSATTRSAHPARWVGVHPPNRRYTTSKRRVSHTGWSPDGGQVKSPSETLTLDRFHIIRRVHAQPGCNDGPLGGMYGIHLDRGLVSTGTAPHCPFAVSRRTSTRRRRLRPGVRSSGGAGGARATAHGV